MAELTRPIIQSNSLWFSSTNQIRITYSFSAAAEGNQGRIRIAGSHRWGDWNDLVQLPTAFDNIKDTDLFVSQRDRFYEIQVRSFLGVQFSEPSESRFFFAGSAGNGPIIPRLPSNVYNVGETVDFILPSAAIQADPPITYSISGLPAWLNFDATTRRVHGTAPDDPADTVTVTYSVRDSEDRGRGYDRTFDITVLSCGAPVRGDWVDVAWIDGYFVLLARDGSLLHSQHNSDIVDLLDFATAEKNPDPGVGLAVYGGRLFVFGTRTIETFYNTGTFPFAFRRLTQSAVPIGCAARDTLQVNEKGIFFLGHDGIFYAYAGVGIPQQYSSGSVEKDIAGSQFWKAHGYQYTEEGRTFYSLILTFPDGTKKNWTLDLTTKFWHERTQTDILCMEEWMGWNLVGRDRHQRISTQSLNWGMYDSERIRREAVSSLFWTPEGTVSFHDLYVVVPLADVDDNVLVLSYSDDSKETADPTKQWTRHDGRGLGTNEIWFSQLGSEQGTGRHLRLVTETDRQFKIDATVINTSPLESQGGPS